MERSHIILENVGLATAEFCPELFDVCVIEPNGLLFRPFFSYRTTLNMILSNVFI